MEKKVNENKIDGYVKYQVFIYVMSPTLPSTVYSKPYHTPFKDLKKIGAQKLSNLPRHV